jgi:cytochrome c oxidase subunit 2
LRRKPLLLTLIAAAIVALLALAGPASADLLSPESGGSPNADRIDTLYWVIFAIALVVFIGVESALLYSLIKFRARRGAVAAQIRGNTRLEIGWTIGAALILVALAVVTFAKLGGIRTPDNSGPDGLKLANGVLVAASPAKRLPPNGKSLNICVNGQQYLWRYTYQADCSRNDFKAPFAYYEMVVPTDTTVTLDITGQDVAHSWWIPRLGGKFDAIPGYVNHTWFKIPGDQAGHVFHGQCAELCGRNHADMTAAVRAVTPSQFEAWLEERKRDIESADKSAQEQRKEFEGTGKDSGTEG